VEKIRIEHIRRGNIHPHIKRKKHKYQEFKDPGAILRVGLIQKIGYGETTVIKIKERVSELHRPHEARAKPFGRGKMKHTARKRSKSPQSRGYK